MDSLVHMSGLKIYFEFKIMLLITSEVLSRNNFCG